MRVCVLSDVHVDINPWDWCSLDGYEADVAVFAGDVSNRVDQTVRWITELRERYLRVVWVAGNHDYYNLGFCETRIRHASDPSPPHSVAEIAAYYQDWSQAHDVDFLHRQCVSIQGIDFIGATGWHDYVAGAPVSRADQIDIWYRGMRDNIIPWQKYSQPHHTQPALAGAADVEALATMVEHAQGPTIVVTHHLPHRDLCWQKPHDRAWTALHGSFANTGMESIRDEKIRMWIYGHTHSRGDKLINGQRYLCNALGYPLENPGWTPVLFDIDEKTGIIS